MAERKKLSFEEYCVRLEEIAGRLEDEKLPLEESLKLYEEGMKIVNKCNMELANVERKIKILTMGDDGKIEESDISHERLG